ncbi:MAG: protoheme IX farnesyltransferase [Chloroflexi bacterium]|nr:protoheme IX farnesyltransferase [Chloroflexota bacterium]
MQGTIAAQRARSLREAALAYLSLTKPRIIMLLLITTVPAMILAKGGWPSPWLMLVTVAGGAIVAGGANAMNCYFDRDIDRVMQRTRSRPLPAGQIEPERAVVFALLLAAIGFLMLQTFANLLAATLTLGAFAFYVVVYTLLLKRTTPLNIVIGGAAGAMPPVVGWAAVTGEVGLPALVLFGIVAVWTPPHFWALALNYSNDYRRAGVPMLPAVSGGEETKRQILLYSLALVAISLLLPLSGATGLIYLSAALVLGGGFLFYAFRLWRGTSAGAASALFRYSIIYLALLFGAMAVDGLVGG